MTLTLKQKKRLRNSAHSLKPVVMIGQHGLTENVMSEIEQALDHHELIKVRVNADDRQTRGAMVDSIAETTQADLVQRIGHIAVFYRPNPEQPRIHLSD